MRRIRGSHSSDRWLIIFCIITVLSFILYAAPKLLAAPQPDPLANVRALIDTAGSYRFQAEVEQTLVPRPLPEMIGKTSEHTATYVEGQTVLPDQRMITISSYEYADLSNTLLESDGITLIRSASGWQVIDMPAELVASNTDYLTFLNGATNVEVITRNGRSGFTFTLDGAILAEKNRADMQAALQAQGALPAGTELSTADALAAMTGTGELWLDAEGYPTQLILDLDQPKTTDVYDARSHVVMTLSDFGAITEFPTPVLDENGMWRIEQTPIASEPTMGDGSLTAWMPALLRNEVLTEITKSVDFSAISMLLFCVLLAVLWMRFNRRIQRLTYALLVLLVTISMIFTPLLKSISVTDFNRRLVSAQEQAASAFNTPYNAAAHASLLQASGGDDPAMCGDGDPSVDSDGDGLNDRTENCIGTDPYDEDSDGDELIDSLEVNGVEWPTGSGKMWYGDPVAPDSNGDGLVDLYDWPEPDGRAPEWDTDNDGIPALWDDDNDGDGVPDAIDVSPFAYTDALDEFSLHLQRADDFDGYQYIEIQVRPSDPAHLRYNLASLDWPWDYQGQIRDYNSSKDDVNLTPALEIQTNWVPDADLREEYGLIVSENEDNGYTMYAMLSSQAVDGEITNFRATIAYDTGDWAQINWDSVRLVWIADVKNDSWKRQGDIGYRLEENRTTVYVYDDEVQLTGMQITRGTDFVSTVMGTPASPNDDRTLFNALLGTGSTNMRYQTPTIHTVVERFSNPNANADVLYTWGVHPNQVAVTEPVTTSDRIGGIADMNARMTDFLVDEGYSTGSNPSLVTLFEEKAGAWRMDDEGSGALGASFSLDLDNVGMDTNRSLKLTTYEYESGEWTPMNFADTLHLMQDRYSSSNLEPVVAGLQDDYPELTEEELQSVVLTFYSAWLQGRNKTAWMGEDPIFDPAPTDLDQQTFDQLYLPDAKYDNLSAYLLEAAELGKPGGGLRIGKSLASNYAFKHANGDLIDAISINIPVLDRLVDMGEFVDYPLPHAAFLIILDLGKMSTAVYGLGYLGYIGKFSNFSPYGAIGALVSIYTAWVTYAFQVSGVDDPITKNLALSYALGATIVAVLSALMSTNVFTGVLLLTFYLVDLIVLLVYLIGGHGSFSLTAEVTKWFAKLFYDARMLTEFESIEKDTNSDAGFKDESAGPMAGNTFYFSQDYEATISFTEHASDNDKRDSASYGQYQATSEYAQVAAQNSSSSRTIEGSEITLSNEARVEIYFNQPKRDVKITLNFDIYTRTYYETCSWWGASCDRHKVEFNLPDDLPETDKWYPSEMVLDILPDSLDGFRNWSELSDPDRDADGLSNDREAELGTDPDLWDTDGDGLEDQFEVDQQDELGCDVLIADTDSDGLSDSLEYSLKTEIDNADSDDDGLLDGEEVYHQDIFDDDGDSDTDEWLGGWTLTNVPETSLTLWVQSDPLDADADGDGLNDNAERSFGTSPYAYNDSPHLTLTSDPYEVSPSGTEAAYVEPGEVVTFDIVLENDGPGSIDTSLVLCVPDYLTFESADTMRGDRNPNAVYQGDAGCPDGHAVTWRFASESTLQVWETVSTTVTASVNNMPSDSEQATLYFLYDMGDGEEYIEDRLLTVLDNEIPEVSISAPTEGELIGGGVSEYVVGGNASDDSSWVDRVEVQLPGEGMVTAEGENPWAYTWSLPADGVYDILAVAYDALDHASVTDQVQVMVDNLRPTVMLDLEDGTTITGEGTTVISVTVTGTATDNLSGLDRVQISFDDKPWSEVWTSESAYPLSAVWDTVWELPNSDSASGEHILRIRALDRAGNESDILERTLIVDVLPPTDELGNRVYLNDPPTVQAGQEFILYGVANDIGNAPSPSRPEELIGTLHSLNDATIWFGLPNVDDNDEGVYVEWLGDFNGDRLADMAVGMPSAYSGKGRLSIIYGRAGNWSVPDDMELIEDSQSTFVGIEYSWSRPSLVGSEFSAVGDVNGDGYDDLLISVPKSYGKPDYAYLVYGQPDVLGRDLILDGVNTDAWVMLVNTNGKYYKYSVGSAGDINGDGLMDLLVEGYYEIYVVLGQRTWSDNVVINNYAAAIIEDSDIWEPELTTVGDLNGDNYDDFVVTDNYRVYIYLGSDSYESYNRTTLTLGDADITFTSANEKATVVALGDVDGDGLSDMMFSNGSSPKLVYGNTNSSWSTYTFDHFDPPPNGFLAAPGDVNNDGLADILMGNSNDDAYLILGGALDDVQATISGVSNAASAPYAAGADINSDGASDIALVPSESEGSAMGMASFGQLTIAEPTNRYLGTQQVDTGYVVDLHNIPYEPNSLNTTDATTRYVNDDTGCEGYSPCYSTPQAAINDSSAGDTIMLQAGAYASFLITVDDLTVQGVYADAVFVDGAGGPYAIKVLNATGVTLENMTLRDADSAVLLEDAGVGGGRDTSLRTTLDTLLVYDYGTHAVEMDVDSSAALVNCTLAGGEDHIEVIGSTSDSLDANWTEINPANTPATTDGGGMAAYDGALYVIPGGVTQDLDAYDIDAGTWSSMANLPIETNGTGCGPVSDGLGNLYAVPGGQWDALGFGLGAGSSVNDSLVLNDDVYIAGDFSSAGGTSVNNLARWDGSAWYDVGGGVTKSGGGAYLNAMASDSNGALCVTGDFDQAGAVAADSIACWSSGVWHVFTDTLSFVPTALDFTTDDTLFVGSCDTEPGGINGLWYMSNGTWQQATTDCVYDIDLVPDFDDEVHFGTDDGVKLFDISLDEVYQDWSGYFEGPVYDIVTIDHGTFYAGGDFTASNDGITSKNVALIDYTCPGGGCSYNVIDNDGGVSSPVYALTRDGEDLYVGGAFVQTESGVNASYIARWDGDNWKTVTEGNSQGTNGVVTALTYYHGMYTFGDFTVAGGSSAARATQWSNPLYMYDISGNSWTRKAALPIASGEGCAMVSDGTETLYAVPGEYHRRLYAYDVATGDWTSMASTPAGMGDGASLTWAADNLYALRGNEQRDLYRYDPASNDWVTMTGIDESSGVVGVGGSLVSDGRDWLYAMLGGDGYHFQRYNIPDDTWEILGDGITDANSNDDDTPEIVTTGGALVYDDEMLYAVPGGSAALWSYGPVGEFATKLLLTETAFVVSDLTTEGTWTNLALDQTSYTFGIAGAANRWIGGSATIWDPDPTAEMNNRLHLGEIITYDDAGFIDPDRNTYRIGATSVLTSGYATAPATDVVYVPTDYAFIQDALLSGAGRVIIEDGTYDQSFYLVSGVDVVGERADRTVLEAPADDNSPIITAQGVVNASVSGVTLAGDNRASGMVAEGGAEYVTLSRTIVRDTTQGVMAAGGGTDLELVNATVVDNDYGMVASACAPVDVRNTIFAYNTMTGLTHTQGPANLIAHWTLDEDAGATSFADSSGNGHTASCSSGACPQAGVTGQRDSAVMFDGADDVVESATANPDGLQNLSVMTWVWMDQMPASQIMRFVTLHSEKAVLRYDGINGSGQLDFYVKIDDSNYHLRVNDILEARTWYHVAGTYDGQIMRLYLNGEQVASQVIVGTVNPGTGVRLSHSTETLDGKLDDVRLYDRALDAGEVLGLYQGCGEDVLHSYNLYWTNGTDLEPSAPGAAEIFLNPRFNDAFNHDYTTDDLSPVIDAGNPTDPHPPGTGEVVDIGYLEQGRAAYYADDDYSVGGINDGLIWDVDAFATIADALAVAADAQKVDAQESTGDIVCRYYASDDVPWTIGEDDNEEILSGIDVEHAGTVVDVNIHHVEGTHSQVSDLSILLQSPSGYISELYEPTSCNSADFHLGFDDNAGSLPPCPATDGSLYQTPYGLSNYQGVDTEGTWTLHVRDETAGNGGTLQGWTLELCYRPQPATVTVGVGEGTYTETVTVPAYVNLVGVDADDVIVEANGVGPAVTVDGATHVLISGLTLMGNSSGPAVLVEGASNNIEVTRCLIRNSQQGVLFQEAATGVVRFNTLVGSGWSANYWGVATSDSGSQVEVSSNIITNYDYAMRAGSDSSIVADYNLMASNDDTTSGEVLLLDGNTTASAGFVGGGDYHLQASSSAVDAASPFETVPAGGGSRADMGYAELIAMPITLFMGKEGESTAIGSSGLTSIETAVVAVSDPSLAPVSTLPGVWDTVFSDPVASNIQVTWAYNTSPVADGLYRIYSRATDAVDNRPEDESDWYVGAYIADSTSPTVAWISPSGNVATSVELRAEAGDWSNGSFSVDSVHFEVNGTVVPATWAAEPWDVLSGQPRVFRAWIDLSLYTSVDVVAVAFDKAGHRSETSPVSLYANSTAVADVLPPTLVVVSPLSGSAWQDTVQFQGTVLDAGSGVASVEVSLDGGTVWIPADLSGSNWNLNWEAPRELDYVSYPGVVRATDLAGNIAETEVVFAMDNVPPRLLYTTRFKAKANVTELFETTVEGDHFDYPPVEFQIGVYPSWDGSDADGSTVEHQWILDQNPDTPMNPLGTWHSQSSQAVYHENYLSVPGEWYSHLGIRDTTGNVREYHYGPWYVGSFTDALYNCNQRVQTIELDGYLDLEHSEWTEFEFLDDDERSGSRQALYTAWDGDYFWVGWQGSWWDVDGTMWIYLSTNEDGYQTSVEAPYYELPFKANKVLKIEDSGQATYYWSQGGYWQSSTTVDYAFANGDSGGTEIRIPWTIPLNGEMDVRLLAYAYDEGGEATSVFPTTNPIDGDWDNYYYWNTICAPYVAINEYQQTWWDLGMELYSLAAPDLPVGANSVLTYVVELTNNEEITSAVPLLELTAADGLSFLTMDGSATCDLCPSFGDLWILSPQIIPPGETLLITLTAVMDGDLTGLDYTVFGGQLELLGEILAQGWITQEVDSDAPLVTINTNAGNAIDVGQQMLSGTASDGDGGGVVLVEWSADGVNWQPADGLSNWAAGIDVPASPTTQIWYARATDDFGLVTVTSEELIVDTEAPEMTLVVPQYLIGEFDGFGGVITDALGIASDVDVQIDGGDWQPAVVQQADAGDPQNWRFTWALPLEDGVSHVVDAQGADEAGNGCNPPASMRNLTVIVDNVDPVITVTQRFHGVVAPLGAVVSTVISGTVTDGSGVDSVMVRVIDPEGGSALYAATLDNDTWQAVPEFTPGLFGEYDLRIEVTDNAGNTAITDNYDTLVCETLACLNTGLSDGQRGLVAGDTYSGDLTVANVVTWTLESGVTITGTFGIDTATLILPTTPTTVTGQFTNAGTVIQMRNVVGTEDVNFADLDAYGGLIINANGVDLGSTTVRIQGNQDCTTVPGETVRRCFDITPEHTSERDATITYYFADSELSGNVCEGVNAYHGEGGNTWTLLALDTSWGVNGRVCDTEPYSLRVTGVTDFSPFVLKGDGTPLAVTVDAFRVQQIGLEYQMLAFAVTLGTVLGLYVWTRSRKRQR